MAIRKIKLPNNSVLDIHDARISNPQPSDNGKVLGVTDTVGTLGWMEQSGGAPTQITLDKDYLIIEPNGSCVLQVITNHLGSKTRHIIDLNYDTDEGVWYARGYAFDGMDYSAFDTEAGILYGVEHGAVFAIMTNGRYSDTAEITVLSGNKPGFDTAADPAIWGSGIYEQEYFYWSVLRSTPEIIGHKVTNLNQSFSSDDRYPSAKAVKTYVDGIVGNIEALLAAI